jgi:hypothetical protein
MRKEEDAAKAALDNLCSDFLGGKLSLDEFNNKLDSFSGDPEVTKA